MNVKIFFEPQTATFTYVLNDPKTKKAAIIDPVLNFNLSSGEVSFESVNEVIDYISDNGFELEWILETHAHADHLTGASYIKNKLGGKIAIGKNIETVIDYWAPLFNIQIPIKAIISSFDHLFEDGEIFHIGEQAVEVIHTPGHTPACLTYHINDMVFVGDTIFMPYVGTARTDFPGGSAKTLYQSIQKILSLPENTKIYTCHDYPPKGQEPSSLSTVKEQLEKNKMVNKEVSEGEFIEMRNTKDKGKEVPKLLYPSLQVNIFAGHLPKSESNGKQYVKIPLTLTQ